MISQENSFGLFEGDGSYLPFGRKEVIREIFGSLENDQGAECFSLVGAKYLGKTLILRTILKNRVQRQFLKPETMARVSLIYFNCEDLPANRIETFRELGAAVIRTATQKWGIKFQSGLEAEYNEQLKTSQQFFTVFNAFEGILKILANKYNKSIVFVLDDFHYLLELLSESDIQSIRDVFEKTPHALVTATLKFIREHTPKTFSSKFYEIFKHYRLGAFTLDQAYDFLHEIIDPSSKGFSRLEQDIILRKAGQHPHFLRVYAEEAWRQKNQLLATQAFAKFDTIDRIAKVELNNCFLSLWDSLNEELQSILYQFVDHKVSKENIMGSLQTLEEVHGLVYRTPDGDFKAMGELFSEFVRSQTGIIDYLLSTDYYRAGFRAMKKLHGNIGGSTDPQYYYQKAFQLFSAPIPDYKSARLMIHNTFTAMLDIIIKRAEAVAKQAFVGTTVREKLEFVKEALGVDILVIKLLADYFDLGERNTLPITKTDTQLRFYMLSGISQCLVELKPRTHAKEDTLGEKYRVIEFVAATSHSQVVKAWHKKLDRVVAIKLLRTDSQTNSKMANKLQHNLLREAQIVAKLRHPFIGQVFDIIEDPFGVVIEWVEGDPLQDCLDRQEEFDIPRILRIGIKLASALEYAHSKGVVHRDIKPSNIVLVKSDEPILIDFDIARATTQDTISLNDEGVYFHIGTVKYSAPEQFDNPNKIGPPTDIFSLGIVLYELMTHKLPFQFGNELALYGDALPQPDVSCLPKELHQIICATLHSKPEERPSAAKLLTDLQGCLELWDKS